MRRGDHKPPVASAVKARSATAYVRALRHQLRQHVWLPRIGHIGRAGRVARSALARPLGADRHGIRALAHVRGILALLGLSLTLLLAGGASTRIADVVTGTQRAPVSTEPTASPWPTPTPTPKPPPPLSIPLGWQVYRGHHFSLAFPPGWMALEHATSDARGEAAAVSFQSPDGVQVVGISEHEGLDAATLKQYCAQPGTPITYAGLPMITMRTAGTVRMFVFVATSDIAYTLLYSEEGTPQEVKWLYDSILSTFRPEYAISACQETGQP